MARPFATLLFGLGLVAGLACGRKGPLELPAGREPMAVEGLTAVQRGETVVLEWTNPAKAVSGRPLTGPVTVEIWVFDQGLPPTGRPLVTSDVEKTARLARRIPKEEFGRYLRSPGVETGGMTFTFAFAAGAAAPKSLAFTVRVFDAKGRASDFSPPVAVKIVREIGSSDALVAKGARP